MAVKLQLNTMFLTVIHIAYIYCLFAILMLNMCFGLYEDQVGLFDWRQQYIGNAKHVYFEQSTTHSKRVFATTEENVLAALNARTGHIMWRKVFERKDGVIESLLHSSNLLVTVSAQGRTVRSWDPNKGHLIWESISQQRKSNIKVQNEKLINNLKGHDSILLSEEEIGAIVISSTVAVRMISQSDGSDIWEYVLPDSDSFVMGVTKIPDRIIVFVSKLEDDHSININIKHLDIENGKLIEEVSLLAPSSPWHAEKDVTCDLVSNKFLICLISEDHNIIVNDYIAKSDMFHTTQLSSLVDIPLKKTYSATLQTLSESSDKFFVRLSNNHLILATVNDSSGSIELIRQVHKSGFYSEVYLSQQKYIFEVFKDIVNNAENLQINVYKPDNVFTPIKKLETRIALGTHSGMGIPVHGTVYAYSKRNDINYRIVVAFEEYSLSLIQNMGNNVGKILWVRNEALSGVTLTEMIELPPSASASKLELLHNEFAVVPNSGILTMFVNRVKSQIRQVQAYMENLKKQQQRYLDANLQHNKEERKADMLKRDQFNIIKVALFMTKSRKLFALNTHNGDIVWSHFLREIHSQGVESHVTIFEQRTTAHFPLPPQCILISRLADMDIERKTAIYTFNPLNGEGLEGPVSTHPFEVLHVAELPFQDENSLKAICIIDTDHYVHIYPNTPETIEKTIENLDKVYVYLVNTSVNTFVGYKVKYVQSKFELYEVWKVNIPNDQVIKKLKTKRNDEVVNSVGRVLGDHTVLYKYLNPNLIGFMTAQGSGLKGAIFVYILDAVTGHIVYQARHKGSDEPFYLILSEHWLIYSYHNAKGRRMELSVVEFYEGYEEKNNTAFSSLDPIGPPMVLSQGYMLPVGGIASITATCTERGITNKNILIALENGYIYSIPKNFLDPRRSFKQTPMLQEEGLHIYVPELPLVPQGYINYNQTVQRIRGIHTSSAGLESTSLVLAYGLDLYYTRVTPSKMFDVLKEDFDYIFISGVLSLLVMTAVVCSKLASMRSLKLAWS